jgi:predicted AAA+ superfamily ATPase
MAMDYLQRGLEAELALAAQSFPAVVLSGPRQVGKTTLLQHLFGATHQYVSLDDPAIRTLAVQDPRGFLDLYRPPVIFDEIQAVPSLLPYLKVRIDEDRRRMGQYLLTGSQNLLLMESVTESLAGRAAYLRMWPMAQRELDQNLARLLPWEAATLVNELSSPYGKKLAFCERLLIGGYPDAALADPAVRRQWFASYIHTYLERDVRQLRNVGDLSQFQNFIKAVALRSGQLLNLSDVARDLGLAVNTVKAWLSNLEVSGLVIVLQPYFENMGKRLVKTPKVYFTDTGLLCHLTDMQTAEQLALSPFGGAVMETAIVMETVKALSFHGKSQNLYFWRTSNGAEVDLVIEHNGKLMPVEAKLSATPKISMTSGIQAFKQTYGDRSGTGWVVYSGDQLLPLGNQVVAVPFRRY